MRFSARKILPLLILVAVLGAVLLFSETTFPPRPGDYRLGKDRYKGLIYLRSLNLQGTDHAQN